MVSLGGHLRHFWAVGPRRSATCDNCALEALLLTYLLTHNSKSVNTSITQYNLTYNSVFTLY